MREIKFRAWDTDKNKMVKVDTIDFYNGNVNDVDFYNQEMHFGFSTILLQYTGLKDKNGTEIYEGDIIKYVYRKPMLPELYVVKDMTNYHDMRILEKIISKTLSVVEVIGNIYEHPHLLKE